VETVVQLASVYIIMAALPPTGVGELEAPPDMPVPDIMPAPDMPDGMPDEPLAEHNDAPAVVPDEHGKHREKPIDGLYDPTGQAAHDAEFTVALNVPAAHGKHCVPPEMKPPAGHDPDPPDTPDMPDMPDIPDIMPPDMPPVAMPELPLFPPAMLSGPQRKLANMGLPDPSDAHAGAATSVGPLMASLLFTAPVHPAEPDTIKDAEVPHANDADCVVDEP